MQHHEDPFAFRVVPVDAPAGVVWENVGKFSFFQKTAAAYWGLGATALLCVTFVPLQVAVQARQPAPCRPSPTVLEPSPPLFPSTLNPEPA